MTEDRPGGGEVPAAEERLVTEEGLETGGGRGTGGRRGTVVDARSVSGVGAGLVADVRQLLGLQLDGLTIGAGRRRQWARTGRPAVAIRMSPALTMQWPGWTYDRDTGGIWRLYFTVPDASKTTTTWGREKITGLGESGAAEG